MGTFYVTMDWSEERGDVAVNILECCKLFEIVVTDKGCSILEIFKGTLSLKYLIDLDILNISLSTSF